MNRVVLFEGKVTLGGELVDFRIYKHTEEDGLTYFSYATNPELRNEDQMDFRHGETLRAETLEDLLFRFRNIYSHEFTKVVEKRQNPDF